ncbi:hypothetical protein [Haloplanus halobius]|uniref:hypothetical protein n=1 Tax=Haloplanus halobius TaxID=2934938 RepID=UPI0020104F2C|nr:hypothetical protein [Haloplanus sp. XH21]
MEYQPGQCNIGSRQRRRRAALAVASMLVALGIVGGYLADELPRFALVVLFVPLAMAFEWGIQAYESFCVRLAVFGRYDFSGSGADDAVGTVSDPAARRADRRSALRISVVSVVLAAVTTALCLALL